MCLWRACALHNCFPQIVQILRPIPPVTAWIFCREPSSRIWNGNWLVLAISRIHKIFVYSHYCRHVGVRHPSVVHKPIFSETVKWINAKFGGKLPVIVSPDHFLFLKILNFLGILHFHEHGTIWEKKHLWKYTTDSPPNIHAYSKEGLYWSCSRNCEISYFRLFLFFFFYGRLTW